MLRTDLQSLLETLLGSDYVYFQPPESVKIEYPCIIYGRASGKTHFADDNPYIHKKRYQVMVIDKDPDSDIPDKVAALPTCVFIRHYNTNNMNHDVYNLYY